MATSPKRRRVDKGPNEPVLSLDDDDSYEAYVPVALRREAQLAKLANRGSSSKVVSAREEEEDREREEDEEKEEERRKEKARKERTLLEEAQEVHLRKAEEGVHFLFIVSFSR
jgi:ATP-dependent RNA helicase DDX41